MKGIFQGGFDRNSVRSSDYNAEEASGSSKPRVKSGTIPKKILQKVGMFLGGEKVSIKHHDLPRNSPQLHHDLPSQNTTKTQNPPAKTALHNKNIFF
jgi:hypothetical protein